MVLRVNALAPLRGREFRLLFAARVVSFLGSAMAPVALAFAILDLTGSTSDLGFVLAARLVPQVLFLLAGGVWSDRLPRHRVMVSANVGSGAAQAAVALLLLTGHARIWELAALSAVNGATSAFFFPASQGIVPQTVPDELRQQGNALLRLGLNSSGIAGGALGGLIVAGTSPGTAIAIDAGTFLAAAALTRAMRVAPAGSEPSTFLSDLRAGWTEFSSRTWLWAIVLQFAFVNALCSGAENVLGPVVAKSHLGGAAAWGSVLASQTAGLVAGGLVMLRFHPARLLRTGVAAIFLAFPFLAALAIPLPLAAIAALALTAGLGIEIFSVMWDTCMQQEIPADRLSRVYGYDMLGSVVLIPVGYATVGPLASAIGTSETLWLSFAICVAVTVATLAVRDVRELGRAAVSPPTP
jgi:MFS family permease